jgi:hypothetical protein
MASAPGVDRRRDFAFTNLIGNIRQVADAGGVNKKPLAGFAV